MVIGRAFSTGFRIFDACGNCPIQKPVPLVFICGEFLHLDSWKTTTGLFSKRGYSGMTIQFPNDDSIDGCVSTIHDLISSARLTSPILITHSFSSYLGQRYLESFGPKALIMINPIPPKLNKAFLSRLRIAFKQDICKYYSGFENSHYENNDNFMDINLTESLPKSVFNLLKNPNEFSISIEPNAVPMRILISSGDYLFTCDELNVMKEIHGVDLESDIAALSTSSRAPMLDSNFSKIVDRQLFDWIEEIY